MGFIDSLHAKSFLFSVNWHTNQCKRPNIPLNFGLPNHYLKIGLVTIALGVLSANNINVYEVALIKQKKLEIMIQVFIIVFEMNLLVHVRFKTRLQTFFTHPPLLVFVTCQST